MIRRIVSFWNATGRGTARLRGIRPPVPHGRVAHLANAITAIAAFVALSVALLPPVGRLLIVHAREAASLQVLADILAFELAQQPSLGLGGAARLAHRPGDRIGVRVARTDGSSVPVPHSTVDSSYPTLHRTARIIRDGADLGLVELSASLRPGLHGAGLILILSATLGATLFHLLRTVPLRLLHRAMEHAAHLAAHDTLTGLPNRASFQDRLRQALLFARREGGAVAVLVLDIHRFRQVNDRLGHMAGDMVLQAVAHRLGQGLRASDTLARLGGDEFAIIQTGAPQPEAGAALAQRMLALFHTSFDLGDSQAPLTAHVGIAIGASTGKMDASRLAQQADLALGQAKQEGEGFRFYSAGITRPFTERLEMEQDLRGALAGGQFYLAYQPLIHLTSGQVNGAEALLRWERPGHGLVPPDHFIGLAEETGLIGPIGTWVLHEACRQATQWPAPLTVAVNVSAAQFRQPGLCETVEAALRGSGLMPQRLELEITESTLLRDTQETLATLARLRALGVRIAMDDFGTGYSSLGYLRSFAFDKIKIDRSFVRHMAEDPNAKAIIHGVLGISQSLGIRANAEGVENDAQAELLRQEGCEEVQGFLFGRPMSPAQFAELCRFGPQAALSSADAARQG